MLEASYYEKFGVRVNAENRKRILELENAHKKYIELLSSFEDDFPLPKGKTWGFCNNDLIKIGINENR